MQRGQDISSPFHSKKIHHIKAITAQAILGEEGRFYRRIIKDKFSYLYGERKQVSFGPFVSSKYLSKLPKPNALVGRESSMFIAKKLQKQRIYILKVQRTFPSKVFDRNSHFSNSPTMAKHHPDLIMCRKQPGIGMGLLFTIN